MHYLITGGTGYVGTHFIQSLGANDRVTVLSRRKDARLSKGSVITSLDAIDSNASIDVVINLAGKPIDCLWTTFNRQELKQSRIRTTTSLIALMKRLKAPPKVFLSASAVGYYGAPQEKILDESAKGAGGFAHSICESWENEAFKACALGVRTCVMRFGVVVGKKSGFVKKVMPPFKMGVGGVLGDGLQPFSWIHIFDLIQAMHFLIAHDEAKEAYNFTAPNLTTNKDMIRALGQVLNRPTCFSVPSFAIKLLLGDMGRELLLQGNHVTPQRLTALGFKFEYASIKDAFAQVCHSAASTFKS